MAESYGSPKSKHPVRMYFNFDPETQKSECIIGNCPEIAKFVQGDHSGNLNRHLKRYHENEANIVEAALKKPKKTEDLPNGIPVYFTPQQIIDALVTLTTVNGRPYSIIDDSGLRMLIDPITEAFKSFGKPITINRLNIKAAGDEKFNKVKRETTELLKSRKIALQLDLASCENKHILGIDADYVENGVRYTRSLAMINLKERSTGMNIAKHVLNVLKAYSIKLRNVNSITTDNGANVVLAVKILKAYKNNSLDMFFEGEEEFDFDSEDMTDFTNLINENACRIEYDCEDMPLHIACSAHSANLAIGDTISKCTEVKSSIEIFRDYAKKLRTPILMGLLKQNNQNMALLDVSTRWSSVYNMLLRLDQLKPFTTKLPNHLFGDKNMTESNWDDMKDIIEVLKPTAILMKNLQNVHKSLSDAFAYWTDTILALEELQTQKPEFFFLDTMLDNIQTRFKFVSSNALMLASVYLDPRYQLLLDSVEKNKAIDYLTKLHLTCSHVEIYQSQANQIDNLSQINLTPLEKLLRAKEVPPTDSESTDAVTNIRTRLIDFGNIPRQPTTSNLLLFWEENKSKYFELHSLAIIVHASPSTEVKIERNFSTLKFVLNRLRNSLSDYDLEKILIIKFNSN